MKKCDIIIPIYNAYDYVKKCVESIVENTEFEGNKLILIDDQSPDKRIWKLLNKFNNEYDFVEIYQNEENLGFVGTVNKGMSISENDVVLLNSDTEVTKNWLKKMSECAYSKRNVATVTPLSNNATLASVPNCFVPNDIPKGYTLEEMGELVEKCSKNVFPEIPTGHGFCLYIKRSVLDEVGLFDAEAYGKGYGEENDFCFRCLDHGYRHILCDNTYIFHKESQSFSDSKIELQKAAGETLRKRYPLYCDKLDYWCQVKPLKYIAANIALSMGLKNARKNILCVIHDWNLEHLGGTTMHLYDLVKGLRKKYNFHIFTFDNGVYKLYSYWENSETEISFSALHEFHSLRYYNDEYKDIFEKIIKDFDIDVVHIHHLINHYFDIVDIIKKYNLKTVLSIHDYFSVCPLITKLYQNKHYCGDYKIQQCNLCLKEIYGFDDNSICNWHKEWERVFKIADKIICPSDSCKNELLKTYSNLNIDIIEHGIDYENVYEKLSISEDKVLNVAFVGAIGIHKGRNVLNDLITKYKNNKIKIHLFGTFDGNLPKNSKYFQDHGSYKRKDLPKLLKDNNIKVVCLLSLCPETFSYTLSEIVACGIPVLTYDIGAIASRVRKDNLGWILNLKCNSDGVNNKLLEIKNNPKEYNKIIKNINKYKVKTVKMMCDDYRKIYNKYIDSDKQSNLNEENIYTYLRDSNKSVPLGSFANYSWVFDTLKWKIISKFKIPKVVKKMYHGVLKK